MTETTSHFVCDQVFSIGSIKAILPVIYRYWEAHKLLFRWRVIRLMTAVEFAPDVKGSDPFYSR